MTRDYINLPSFSISQYLEDPRNNPLKEVRWHSIFLHQSTEERRDLLCEQSKECELSLGIIDITSYRLEE